MKRTLAVVVAVTAVLGTSVVSASAGAAGGHRPEARTLQRDADALLAQGAPGVLAELDTPRGEVKVRSGYGDVARRTPVPWEARFRAGSFTKTFVAVTVLQLVGEGKLGLDDTVERWLPGVVAGNGNDGSKITVRQLLQHTSGLHDYVLELPHLFLGEQFLRDRFKTTTPREAVAKGVAKPPTFQPGEGWRYSNTGYALAGMIIERVTGRTWQQEVRDRVVKPLGLRATSLPGTSPHIPNPHATGYERFPEKGLDADPNDPRYGEPLDVTLQNPSWGGAAGEMITTTEDGNRFLRALFSGAVLRPAQFAEMTKTVPAPAFEAAWPGVRYGLGIMWAPNECGGVWSHGGDIMGFMTRNGVTSDGSRSVVVTINTDSMVPRPGAPAVDGDRVRKLVDHAICGTG